MQNDIAAADAYYARELGRERVECAWILSDRDVWYQNPFYRGPAVPHPYEDEMDCYYDDVEITEADLIRSVPYHWPEAINDDIPF